MAWIPPSDAVEWTPPSDAQLWEPPSDAVAEEQTYEDVHQTSIPKHVEQYSSKSFLQRAKDAALGFVEQPAAMAGFAAATALGGARALGTAASNVVQGKPYSEGVIEGFRETQTAGQKYTAPQTEFGNILFKGMGEAFMAAGDAVFSSPRFISGKMHQAEIQNQLMDAYKKENKTSTVPYDVQLELADKAAKMFEMQGGLNLGSPAERVASFSEEVVKPTAMMAAELYGAKAGARSAKDMIQQPAKNAKLQAELKTLEQASAVRDQIKAEQAKQQAEKAGQPITDARRQLPNFEQRQQPILVNEQGVAVPMRDATNLDTYRAAAEQKQREATQAQPLPYERVTEPFEPSIIEGTARRVDDGLPYVQEVGSAKVEAAIEALKQREIDLAYRAQAFEEGKTTMSKESAFAEMERLQTEQAAIDSARRQLMEEQTVREPSQASPITEPMIGGIRNRATGRQSGAIDPRVFVDGVQRLQEILSNTAGKLYHRTNAPTIGFVFDKNKVGTSTGNRGLLGEGQYLTSRSDVVSGKDSSYGKNIVEVPFNPANPFTISEQSVRALVSEMKTDDYPLPAGLMFDRQNPQYTINRIANADSKTFTEYLVDKGFDSVVQFTKDGKAVEEAVVLSKPKVGAGGTAPKQRGYINFDAFAKDMKDKGIESDPVILREMYKRMYPTQTPQAKAAEAVDKIPGLKGQFNKYESRPVTTDPLGAESVKRMEAVGSIDLPEPVSAAEKGLMSAGSLQAWGKKSPIVHEAIQYITSAKDYYRIQAANAMTSVNKLWNSFEMRSVNPWMEGSWKDVAEVIKVRRENEFNPNFDPRTVFSGKKLELFNQIDTIIKDLYQKVNQRRKELNPKAEDLPQLPFYFTSFFVGDWAIPVFSKETGQFLFNIRETSKAEAQRAKDWINGNSEFVAKDVSTVRKSKYVGQKLDKASDFDALMQVFGSNDPIVLKAMERMVEATEKSAYGTSGMPSRFLNKSGRIGSMGDKPWKTDKQNYYDNKEAFTRYVEGANDWLANTSIAKMADGMQLSKTIDAPNAKQFVQDYADYVVGRKNKTDTIISKATDAVANRIGYSGSDVRGFARGWANVNTALFIGWYSSRAIVQNAVQWVQATAPKLAELSMVEGYKGDAGFAMVKGLFEGMYDTVGHQLKPSVKDKFGTDSLKFKEANHIVDAHLVEQGRMGKNVWINLAYDFAANKSVAITEQLSRSIAFSIYKAYFESAGFDKARAMDMAKNLTHETMVNYEAYAKPQVFGATGIVGEMAGRLQTYKMNSATQMYNYAKDIKAADPKSFAPLATALGINIAFAGMLGLIGMDVVQLMWQAVQAMDRSVGDPTPEVQEFDVKRFIFDSFPEEWSMGVLSTSTGTNLSGAFSQNLVGDDPLKSIVPVFGGAVDQITAVPSLVAEGAKELFTDEGSTAPDLSIAKNLSVVSPASAKPIIEEYLQTTTTPSGDRQVISPNTEKTVWKGRDQGYIGRKNIQTLERGKYSLEERNQQSYEQSIQKSIQTIGKSIRKHTVDLYKAIQDGKNEKFALKAIEKKLNAYLDSGGDPEAAVTALNQHLEELGVGDEMLMRIQRDVSVGTRKQYQRALERYMQRKQQGD